MKEITTPRPAFDFARTSRRFLYIFIPSLVVLLLLGAIYYRGKIATSVAELGSNERNAVDLQSYVVERNFRDVLSDLMFIASHRELRNYLSKPDPVSKSALMEEWKTLAMSKGVYDKIRLVDRNAHEIVRVQYSDGVAFAVSDEKLARIEDQALRAQSASLRPGEVFVSSFRLAKDNKAVIKPLKPLITFCVPIYSVQGDRTGLLVLDFLGNTLIDDIKRSATSLGTPMVIDSQGYWIVGPTREDEWGFVLEGRENRTFMAMYPDVWDLMTERSSGQLRSEAGLFTYTTIFPLMEGRRTSSGAAKGQYFDTGLVRGKAYSWKLISHVNEEGVSNYSNSLLSALAPLFAGLIVIAGVLSALLAVASERAAAAEEAFRFQVSRDPLTGIWNRSGILELLRREMARAQRDGSSLSVALADIDGFKAINSELGEAGANEVLRAVSRAICDSIREYDSAGRYAADQFLIALPGCDKSEALIALDRIKAGLEALNEIGYPEGVDVKVSIGVASAKITDEVMLDHLIREAEEDLRHIRGETSRF